MGVLLKKVRLRNTASCPLIYFLMSGCKYFRIGHDGLSSIKLYKYIVSIIPNPMYTELFVDIIDDELVSKRDSAKSG